MESINVNFNNLTKAEKEQFLKLVKKANSTTAMLSEIRGGDTFKIGDITFIKFTDADGVTTAMAKECIFESVFGSNNNFADSDILKRLNKDVLPKIADEIGDKNILEFDTDLTALDGVKTYGKITSKVSLPTLDFYREYVDIFDKYKIDKYFWLATPWSALPHYNSSCVLCVSPSGGVNLIYYFNYFGVRPFFRFVSSISVSREE